MRFLNFQQALFLTGFLTAGLLAVTTTAQTPATHEEAVGAKHAVPHAFPAPTNLQVLPKSLTGKQVHEIMEQWSHSLGVRCSSCHKEDPGSYTENGELGLKFADDSKPMKSAARLMYTMTEGINTNFIAKLEGSGLPVTCGTCHRGLLSPEPFKPKLPVAPLTGQSPQSNGGNKSKQ